MSAMIKCDRCNRLMYTDCRTPKGAYWKVTADGINGYSTMHLCRNCYLDFYKFLNDPIPEDELRPYDESDWGGVMMDDIKIKVIDSDKLVKAINEGSYDVNLSSVMALGAVMLDTKKSEPCDVCKDLEEVDTLYYYTEWHGGISFNDIRDIKFCPKCGRRL